MHADPALLSHVADAPPVSHGFAQTFLGYIGLSIYAQAFELCGYDNEALLCHLDAMDLNKVGTQITVFAIGLTCCPWCQPGTAHTAGQPCHCTCDPSSSCLHTGWRRAADSDAWLATRWCRLNEPATCQSCRPTVHKSLWHLPSCRSIARYGDRPMHSCSCMHPCCECT